MKRKSVWLLMAVGVLTLGCAMVAPLPFTVRETVEVTTVITQVVEVTRIVEITPTPPPTAAAAPTPTLMVYRADFGGTWQTNIATLTLTQTGADVSGRLEGYGGEFSGEVTGVVEGAYLYLDVSQVLPWSEPVVFWMGDDGNTLFSNETGNHWCGVRDGPLPEGCGFSGRWCLTSEGEGFPEKGYAELVQDGSVVRGSVYAENGEWVGDVEGEVQWAKGHGMSGMLNGETALFWWMRQGENTFGGGGVEGVRDRGRGCRP